MNHFSKGLLELVSFPFRYTRQVIDETLRAAVVAPWGARVYEYDLQVDEFVIPKEVMYSVVPWYTLQTGPLARNGK